MLVMIGIDPHKATHTAVAVDDDENVLDEFTLRTSSVPGSRPEATTRRITLRHRSKCPQQATRDTG